MIRTYQATVTTAGSNGSASGNAQTTHIASGRIVAVHLDYTNQPSTTDVTITTPNAPVATILTVNNNNTDGWYYPRVQVQGTTGTGLTYNGTQTVNESIPVDDYIKVAVAQGDDAGTVVATFLVEC